MGCKIIKVTTGLREKYCLKLKIGIARMESIIFKKGPNL